MSGGGKRAEHDSSITSPHRLGRAAAEFYWAAQLIVQCEDQNMQLVGVPAPVMYLIGHSIELALKAFLVDRGTHPKHLSRRFGHDLRKCWNEAVALGLFTVVAPPSEHEARAFDLLNALYSTKELEYVFVEARQLPNYSRLEPLCERLAFGIWKAVSRNHSLDPLSMRLLRYKRMKSRAEEF